MSINRERRGWLPYLGILVFLVLGPLYGFPVLSLFGYPFVRLDLIAAGLLIIIGTSIVLINNRFLIDKVGFLLILFSLLTFSSMTLVTIRGEPGLKEMMTINLQVLLISALYLTIINLQLRSSDWISIGRSWVGVSAIIASFGMYQGFARVFSLPLARVKFDANLIQAIGYGSQYHPALRVASVFIEPAWYGTYLVPPALLCLAGLAIGNKASLFKGGWNLAFSIIFSLAILQSASLLSYIMFLSGVIVLFSITLFRYGIRSEHIAVFCVSLGCGLLVLISGSFRKLAVQLFSLPYQVGLWLVTNDLSHVTAASARVRLEAVLSTLHLLIRGPFYQLFLGRGPNSLERAEKVLLDSSSGAIFQIILDQGIFGVMIFTAIFAYLIKAHLSFYENGFEYSEFLSLAIPATTFASFIMFFQIGYLTPIRWLPILFGGGIYTSITFRKIFDH